MGFPNPDEEHYVPELKNREFNEDEFLELYGKITFQVFGKYETDYGDVIIGIRCDAGYGVRPILELAIGTAGIKLVSRGNPELGIKHTGESLNLQIRPKLCKIGELS